MESQSTPSTEKLLPCPFCKAEPQKCGHYFEVFHLASCFFAERHSDNTRQIIIQEQAERWNTRTSTSAAAQRAAKRIARLVFYPVPPLDEQVMAMAEIIESELSATDQDQG